MYNVASVHLLKANGAVERKILTTSVFSGRFVERYKNENSHSFISTEKTV